MTAHATIYQAPALYDLAFSYRDFDQEAGFLRGVYERRRGRAPARFLELAAGPARHAIAMGAAGLAVTALDRSAAMASYAASLAARRGVELAYVVGDMVELGVPGRFDLAACMLCSATYLLTDDVLVTHLRRVRAALAEGGLYVLELPHPSETSAREKTHEHWTVDDPGGALEVEWSDAVADRGQAVRRSRARLVYRPHAGGPPIVVEDEARQRSFSVAEIEAGAAASGFAVAGLFGAFDERVAIEGERAWRMLAVLGRIG